MSEDSKQVPDARDQAMQVFLRYHEYVQYIALCHAPAEHLQGDIVNDAFIDFIQKADQWDYSRDVRPLLRVITENIAKKYWRDYLKSLPSQLQKLNEYFAHFVEDRVLSSGLSDSDEEYRALAVCIQKLPPRSRQLVDAFYYGGKKLVVIAEETGQNYGTLCKTLMRVREALRQCIESILKGIGIHG